MYGTGAAIPALIAAGQDPSSAPIRRAVRWLEDHQNDDGGWGEDAAPTTTPSGSGAARAPRRRPRGRCSRCTPRASDRSAVHRGIRWLVETQRPDGTWDEPQFTGTGFPSDFYINYHLYRLVFPVMALGHGCAAG